MPGTGFSYNGINLFTSVVTDYRLSQTADLIRNAVDSGANAITLGSGGLLDLSTNAITAFGVAGQAAIDLSPLDQAIKKAMAAGLQVFLSPELFFADPAQPAGFNTALYLNGGLANSNAFFNNYKDFILKYAAVAESNHVSALSVGSELFSATDPKYDTQWNDIISAVRSVYHGSLYYELSVTEDVSSPFNEANHAGFLNKLDFIGVDIYPELSSVPHASEQQFASLWTNDTVQGHQVNIAAYLANLAQSNGKQIVFSQTGSYSGTGLTVTSYAGLGQPGTPTDLDMQSNWYQAFFDVWAGANRPSWLAGAMFWNNDPAEVAFKGAQVIAQDLIIAGKPAGTVVASAFGGGDYLAVGQGTLFGGNLADQLFMYGDARGSASSAVGSFVHLIQVDFDGRILNGQTETLHVFVNGVDAGTFALANQPSTFVDPKGVAYTLRQIGGFQLSGFGQINQLRLSVEGITPTGAPEPLSADFFAVSVDGVALSHSSFITSIDAGGSFLVDASAFNATLASLPGASAMNAIQVDGGPGSDTLHILGGPSNYSIVETAAGQYTLRETAGLGQNANLTNVEALAFQDGSRLRLPTAIEGAGAFNAMVQLGVAAVLRQDDVSFADGLAKQANAGQVSQAAATTEIVHEAAATTSVATLAYEFFTGKVPSAAGMDYLVSPTGPNPNNLNAAYYQSFSLENRYINFAVNLGKVGEGNASFTQHYGQLSLFEATRQAYATIFGGTPSDTKLHALLDPTTVLNGQTFTRADYFAYYGGDGPNGIGTKAAMVGWLLSEAVKADVGTYALSNDAFLADVALHSAPFGVDLVGHYAQPGFVFNPG